MIEKWKEIERTVDSIQRIFVVNQVKRQSPITEDIHDFVVLEASDAVNIIPVTNDGMVVMVRQYRHGVGQVMLEFPAGLISTDEHAGESAEEAANRELLEETGYTAEFMVQTGKISPMPAFYSGRTYMFVAFGCQLTAEQSLDPAENIAVELVPINDIDVLIEQGFLNHAQDIAAFYFFKAYIQKQQASN